MSQTYTAVTKQIDGWWVGWIEEIPGVNCQEATRETLLETLALTLREAIEFNRQEALNMAGSNFREERIAL
ncbi:MAG: type II toxin-antitoxin system HicB family antitoxin [Magnetococcales bacterium]|nr:type II toxin-antitoxin system HicB family antitoxin [Magnetococcales bacterium]